MDEAGWKRRGSYAEAGWNLRACSGVGLSGMFGIVPMISIFILLLLSGFPKRYLVELKFILVLSCLILVYQRYTDLLTPHLTGTGGQVVVLVHQPRLHK